MREAREFVKERGRNDLGPPVALAKPQLSADQGEIERTLESFAGGEALAQEMHMRLPVVQARMGTAQVFMSPACTNEADVKLYEARAMIEETAGLSEDEKPQHRFRQSALSKRA